MDYKEAYFALFAAMADAVEAIDQQNFGVAKKILMETQQKWEDIYIEAEK